MTWTTLVAVVENLSWAGLFAGVVVFEVRDDLARRAVKAGSVQA